MKTKDFYATLGVPKTATEAEIKKAYRKLAMLHHPDRTKGDKASEKKFKEISEAYETLSDAKKRKQYDTFGSAGDQFSGFSGASGGGGWFEDIFSQFWGGRGGNGGFEFDMGDLFGGGFWGGSRQKQQSRPEPKAETPSLDVEITKEIHIFDFILGTKIDVETVYGKHLDLTIKSGTKPGTRFKISGKGRSSDGKTGDMYVKVEAKMPKEVPEDVAKVLEALKYRL